MKKYKDRLLYSTIAILVIVLLFTSELIYARVIDNAIIIGITSKEDPYANETVDETLARGQKLIEETDEMLEEAKDNGWF